MKVAVECLSCCKMMKPDRQQLEKGYSNEFLCIKCGNEVVVDVLDWGKT